MMEAPIKQRKEYIAIVFMSIVSITHHTAVGYSQLCETSLEGQCRIDLWIASEILENLALNLFRVEILYEVCQSHK